MDEFIYTPCPTANMGGYLNVSFEQVMPLLVLKKCHILLVNVYSNELFQIFTIYMNNIQLKKGSTN